MTTEDNTPVNTTTGATEAVAHPVETRERGRGFKRHASTAALVAALFGGVLLGSGGTMLVQNMDDDGPRQSSSERQDDRQEGGNRDRNMRGGDMRQNRYEGRNGDHQNFDEKRQSAPREVPQNMQKDQGSSKPTNPAPNKSEAPSNYVE